MTGSLRPLTVAAAVALAFGLMPAAGASGPARSKVVVGHQPSTQRDSVSLLAGSPHWLVYERTPVRLSGSGPTALLARSRAGKVRTLAHGLFGFGWSLSGNWLVVGDGHDNGRTTGVDWWNLSTHRHGRLALPGEESLLTAAPGGATYMTRNGVVHEKTAAGRTKRLGRPFSSEPADYYDQVRGADNLIGAGFVAADDRGMVLGGQDGQAKYLPFSGHGQVTTLQTGGTNDQLCQSVTHGFAGCVDTTLDDDGRPGGDAVSLVPLDGGVPTRAAAQTDDAAVSGSRVVWLSLTGPGRSERIDAIRAGAAAPDEGVVGRYGRLESAYRTVLTSTPSQVATIDDPQHLSRLFGIPRSPATAVALVVAPGRVVDVDDVRTSAASPAAAFRSRRVVATSRKISVGGTSTIAEHPVVSYLSSDPSNDIVFATPGVTAYVHDDGQLTVVSRHGRSDLGPLGGNDQVALSGNRIAYVGHIPGRRFKLQLVVSDLVSGTTTAVARKVAPDAIALWGHTLAWVTARGAVFTHDLRSGHTHRLAASTGQDVQHRQVAVYGHNVAWSYVTRGNHLRSRLSTSTTKPRVRRLPEAVYGASPEGLLLSTNPTATDALAANDVAPRAMHTTVRLRAWSGRVSTLLSRRRYTVPPLQLGHLLAWVAADETLRVAPLAVHVPAPRFLGDPDAPATFDRGTDRSWRLTAPYSLPLRTCRVTIRHRHTTVRRLTCGAAGARQGLADVTWNGTDQDGHAVPAGTYTWQIHAHGDAGGAVKESGAHGPVTGRVKVAG